jgi:hypothetical protein
VREHITVYFEIYCDNDLISGCIQPRIPRFYQVLKCPENVSVSPTYDTLPLTCDRCCCKWVWSLAFGISQHARFVLVQACGNLSGTACR